MLLCQIVVLLIATLLDLTVGDPPERFNRFYPIVWISKLARLFDGLTPRKNPSKERFFGVLYPLLMLFIFCLPCLALLALPELLYAILASVIFKMTFAIKGLERYGRGVMDADNLMKKREAVGKIVSRDVSSLDDKHLNSASIESIAENLTDGIISPLFYFSLFGVFGAMFYRVINTLDAVIGYKSRRYADFGWFSAKMDDLMNYIPERIAAGLICLCGKSKLMSGEAPLTIVAMSNVLKVRLEKIGYYSVGKCFNDPRVEDIRDATKVMKLCAISFTFISIIFMALLGLGGWTWLTREIQYVI